MKDFFKLLSRASFVPGVLIMTYWLAYYLTKV